MESDKKNLPTDEGLKSENPKNRDFGRTEKQTDRVSQSEIDETKREKQEKNNQIEPTDKGLKTENPKNRDFQRTEGQTDRVSQSEIDELNREKRQ